MQLWITVILLFAQITWSAACDQSILFWTIDNSSFTLSVLLFFVCTIYTLATCKPRRRTVEEFDDIQYTVGKLLGTGHYGTVYLGTDQHDNKVALKYVKIVDAQVAEKEIRILESLDHDNVIKLLRKKTTEDHVILVLTYARETLETFVVNKKRIAEKEVRQIVGEIAAGLVHIHSMKIYHQDLKPHNILLHKSGNSDNSVLISDFGSAFDGNLSSSLGKPRTDLLQVKTLIQFISKNPPSEFCQTIMDRIQNKEIKTAEELLEYFKPSQTFQKRDDLLEEGPEKLDDPELAGQDSEKASQSKDTEN